MTVLSKRLVPAIVATAAPSTTDDASKGYKVGMWWFDATHTNIYWCKSNTIGSADWENVTGGGGGSGTVIGAADAAGTGVSVYDAAGSSSTIIAIRTLLGSGCTIVDNGDGTITISVSGGGGGLPTNNYQSTVAADSDLVAYWKCDEAFGATTLIDSKGSFNMPITSGKGFSGGQSLLAYSTKTSFRAANNGATGATHLAPTTGLPLTNTARTIECMFALTGGLGTSLIEFGPGTGTFYASFIVAVNVGTSGLEGAMTITTYGDGPGIQVNTGCNDGKPHHMMATFDGGAAGVGIFNLYLDGALVCSSTAANTNSTVAGQLTLSGNAYGAFSGPSAFSISDIAMYNVVKNAAFALDHYKRAVALL